MPPSRSAIALVSFSAASARVLPYTARCFGPSAVWIVYRPIQRPSLRRVIEPSPLPRRLAIAAPYPHKLLGLYPERLRQLAYRARLGTCLTVLEPPDRVVGDS